MLACMIVILNVGIPLLKFLDPPLPVQYLRAVSNGQNGSITVRWSTPENISSRISAYEIHYKEENHTELTFRTKIVSQWCSKDTLTRADDGIKPLNTYEIQVRAMSESLNTQWTSTTVFVGMLVIVQDE